MVKFQKKKDRLIGDSKFSLKSHDMHHDLYTDLETGRELLIVTTESLKKDDQFIAVLELPYKRQEWRNGEPITKKELHEIAENLKAVYGDYCGYKVILTKPSFAFDQTP